jgi:hypothetical protein
MATYRNACGFPTGVRETGTDLTSGATSRASEREHDAFDSGTQPAQDRKVETESERLTRMVHSVSETMVTAHLEQEIGMEPATAALGMKNSLYCCDTDVMLQMRDIWPELKAGTEIEQATGLYPSLNGQPLSGPFAREVEADYPPQ